MGRAELVDRIRSHPLMRPLRPDKMTLAGLTATLEAYRDGLAKDRIPALALLGATPADLQKRADRLRRRLRGRIPGEVRLGLRKTVSRVGGGSSPLVQLPSWAVTLEHPNTTANALEARLRGGAPPVIARIEEDLLLLDLRAVQEGELGPLTGAVAAALCREGSV